MRLAELSLGNGLICTHLNNTRTNSAVQSPEGNRRALAAFDAKNPVSVEAGYG
jgi:hypothetical protein